MTENKKPEKVEGKQETATLDELYTLAEAKDRKALEFFKNNAMNMDHYMEFRMAAVLYPYTDVVRTESYITISSLFEDRTFMNCIVGIDDTTNKLFCHRLPKQRGRGIMDSDAKVKAAMGFETECIEVGKWIRIQGDLTMKILEQHETTEKMLNSLSKSILFEETRWLDTDIDDVDLDDVAVHAATFDGEIKDDDYKAIRRFLKLNKMNDELELLQKIKGTEGSGVHVHRLVRALESHHKYLKESAYVKKNAERVKQRVYNTIAGREARYTFMRAHHKITMTSSYANSITRRWVRELPDRTGRTFYILRPSVIKIEHPEHGTREIMIDKPSVVTFGFLNRHNERDPGEARRSRQELERIEDERRGLMNREAQLRNVIDRLEMETR